MDDINIYIPRSHEPEPLVQEQINSFSWEVFLTVLLHKLFELSWVTETWLLEGDIAVEFIK